MQSKAIAVIIVLSAGSLAVVRALGTQRIPLIIIERKENQNRCDLKTKYGKKIFVDNIIGQNLINALTKLANNNQKMILFPVMDALVSYLSQHRNELPSNVILPFPSHNIIKLLMDKSLFKEFAEQHRFPIPKTLVVKNYEEVEKAIECLQFPVILKTKVKMYIKGIAKAYILKNKNELISLYKEISPFCKTYILQEFIPGGDDQVYFCMQYISQEGKLLASFTGRKIRQWRPLCGGTATCEPAYAPELHELTYEIFKKANFGGIGSIEYKKDPRDGKYYIIEPTVSRVDYQEGVAIANGVNIPYIAYCDILGLPVKPVIKNGGNKAWMCVTADRLVAEYYIKRGELTKAKWLWSLRKVRAFDLFDLRDLNPTICALKNKIKNKLRRLID